MSSSPQERRRKYSNIKITNNNLVKYSAEGNLDVVKYLVENGVDIYANNYLAFRRSAENGHLDVVKYLVENGANDDYALNYALRWSAENGHLDIVKYLVEKGADIHANDDEALRWSAGKGHLEVVKYLVEKDADIHADNDKSLRWSAENGHLDVVKYLIENNANIHADDDDALRWSAANGLLDVVKYLVENGANIHANNDKSLRWSALKGHLEVVRYLVEKGADIHADNDKSLKWSVENGHLDIVRYLVENGANIHADNDYALRWSAENGHLDVVKYLVENGANIDVINIGEIRKKIKKYIIRKKKEKSILKQVRRTVKQNLPKKDNYITEWQSYCKVINDNSNIEELQKISLSVGLPIMKNNKYLSKILLCSQLGIQLEQYLSNPKLTYEHDCYETAELGTDFSTIPEECIFRDKNDRCFAINDILDNNGYFRSNMNKNPYTRKEWELDIEDLRDIQKTCNKYSKLDIIHKIENYNREDLQLGIVRSILNELDNKIYSNNIISLLEVNLNTLNRLLNFLYNEGNVNYNSNELSNIRNSDLEIDFLAKLLSITRGKVNDDVRLANLIELFFNPI